MADARCPEPKPVTIFLLTIAGAFGGISAGLLSKVFIKQNNIGWRDLVGGGALVGSTLGCSIGLSLALARRYWLRTVVAAFVGGQLLYVVLRGALDVFGLRNVFTTVVANVLNPYGGISTPEHPLLMMNSAQNPQHWGRYIGTLATLGMVASHHLMLAVRWRPIIMAFSYTLMGAASFTLYWCEFEWNRSLYSISFTPYIPSAWVIGAAFGLLQFLAMLAALAVARKMRPRLDPPPSAPSPGPGP